MVTIRCMNEKIDRVCKAPQFSEQEIKLLDGLYVGGIGHIIRYFDGTLAISGGTDTPDFEQKHFWIPSFLLPSLPNGWLLRRQPDEGHGPVWSLTCHLRNRNGCNGCIIGACLKRE